LGIAKSRHNLKLIRRTKPREEKTKPPKEGGKSEQTKQGKEGKRESTYHGTGFGKSIEKEQPSRIVAVSSMELRS